MIRCRVDRRGENAVACNVVSTFGLLQSRNAAVHNIGLIATHVADDDCQYRPTSTGASLSIVARRSRETSNPAARASALSLAGPNTTLGVSASNPMNSSTPRSMGLRMASMSPLNPSFS